MWAALSPDGHEVAAVGRNWVVTRHPLDPPADTPAGRAALEPLVGHEQAVFRAIYTPDGQALATVSSDTSIRLWDVHTGQPLFRLQLPTMHRKPSPLWDFDFRCTADERNCWIAVPLTTGRLALYRLPYADPPPGLARPPH